MAGKEENLSKIFDKKDFFDRVENDFELARQLGEMFIDETRQTMDLIRDLIEQKDADGIRHAAHSLKGASANLSALRLRRITADLEQAAKENKLLLAAEIFSMLEDEVANFTAELERHVLGC
ncbi:MAG: Hpt domain-containing protein [Desulfobacteraceae bacterium]|nr:Hpt domain-containing protein [Desulfobacteraceae bacterium]